MRRRIRRWRRRLRPLTATPLVPLLSVFTAGAIGYRWTENWDWGDCFWGVLVTLTTVGYGDQVPDTDAGRWVTAAILVGGLVVVQQTLQWMLSLQESGYLRLRRRQRQLREIQRMRQHVILCGYGRIGREIADQLIAEGVPLLVIENAPDDARAARERQLEVLEGDATLDETLQEAGVFDCRALVAALPNNAANLYVVLSARGLSSGCRLIARADSKEAERKLRLAGADAVVSPYISGGRQMAAIALRPLAINFLDLLAGSNCEVEEFQLRSDTTRCAAIDGRSLTELDLGRRTNGALVLAIQGRAGLIANPNGSTRLEAGQRLIVMGSPSQLQEMARLLGEALEDASVLKA